MSLVHTIATPFNAVMGALVRSRRGRRVVGGSMTVLRYTGRRSGRTFELPVAYRRAGDDRVVVAISMAERKTWWRNFTGDGGPLTLQLDGRERAGHGTVVRNGADAPVAVDIRLAPDAS